MNIPRRRFLHLAAGAAALPALAGETKVLAYPTRPVRLVVGFAAGGPADITARLIGEWLSERLGQSFIIDDHPGAASNIAVETVVQAPPDGYTLLAITVANAFNAGLYHKLPFNLLRDIEPVAGIAGAPGLMEINPSLPATTVPEFIAYARANPGKIYMASAGPGSAPHLYGELFKAMTGIDLVAVHYRGSGPALPDLLSGQVQVMFDPIISSIGYVRSGALRPLAVTTGTRSELLPDIPTIGEYVPGYEAGGWQGLGAPRNTPREIIDILNKEINAGLADAEFKARLANLGATVLPGSAAEFSRFVSAETDKWGGVIRSAHIKIDE
jgi:tripartite-type tricarboxylate transporter receptor subunit TctC